MVAGIASASAFSFTISEVIAANIVAASNSPADTISRSSIVVLPSPSASAWTVLAL